MVKKIVVLFISYCFSWAALVAQNILPGDLWESYSNGEKLSFLTGIQAATKMYIEVINFRYEFNESYMKTVKSTTEYSLLVTQQVTYEKLMDIFIIIKHISNEPQKCINEMDDFYKYFSNRHVLLGHAFEIVSSKLRGITEDEIRALIEKYRKKDER